MVRVLKTQSVQSIGYILDLPQSVISEHFTITPETLAKQGVSGQIKEKQNND
mgnify:CR=1 FL=1